MLVWVVNVLLTVVFLIAGAMKLLEKAAGMFEHRVPHLVVVMAGAIFTHIRSNERDHVPGVVILLVLAAIIAYARREQLLGASSGAASDLKPPL